MERHKCNTIFLSPSTRTVSGASSSAVHPSLGSRGPSSSAEAEGLSCWASMTTCASISANTSLEMSSATSSSSWTIRTDALDGLPDILDTERSNSGASLGTSDVTFLTRGVPKLKTGWRTHWASYVRKLDGAGEPQATRQRKAVARHAMPRATSLVRMY